MATTEPTRHLLSILVEDRYGELARIVGLFSGRGYNIDSLTVNHTLEPGMSRVVVTTSGDPRVVEQIVKQVNKLVRVHKVRELDAQSRLERELCVATVRTATAKAREDLQRIVALTAARVLSFTATTFTIEASGSSYEIDQFIELIRPLGVRDFVRTAPVALHRAASDGEPQSSPSGSGSTD